MRAYQQQYPDNDVTATILVTVDRNQYAPRFEGIPYQTEISVDTQPGTNVFTVSASDRDGVRTPLLKLSLLLTFIFLTSQVEIYALT